MAFPEPLERLIRARLENVRISAPVEELVLEVAEAAVEIGWQPGLTDRSEANEPLPDLAARLQDTLLPSQQQDGSWIPISTYSDYAGDDRGDRSYTTALCVLTLEVYYRYFPPLLEVDAGGDAPR